MPANADDEIIEKWYCGRMELVLPSTKYKDSFIEAVREYKADASHITTRRYSELSISELESDFETFLEKELSHSHGENLPEGFVSQTEYWLVEGGKYIGHAVVRHRLNDHLLAIGGHIGYNIRPSQRGEGYGEKILALALPKARELGIERVLLTCDETNVASRKIIEKNGGVLENKVPNPETGVAKLRFWIDLP